jgi:aminocarboxymuconate-semialdehyde decarboxylase
MLLPRLEQAISVFPDLRETLQNSPINQARSFYFDTLVFDTPTLKHLVALFGDTQLMIGTDYPFNFHEPRPVQRIAQAGFDAGVVQQLVQTNGLRFLGLPALP